jgi:hypothetical protein
MISQIRGPGSQVWAGIPEHATLPAALHFERMREDIRSSTDKALTDLHNKQAALENQLAVRSAELQELMRYKAKQADIDRTLEHIAVLRRGFEELMASKTEQVDALLAGARRREEEAYKAAVEMLQRQESRHAETMRASQDASTAALTGLAASNLQAVNDMSTKFCTTLERTNSEAAGALREGFRDIKESIVAASNGSIQQQQQIADAISGMSLAMQAFVAADAAREQRKKEKAQQKRLDKQHAAQERLLQDAKRDQQWTEALNSINGHMHAVCVFIFETHTNLSSDQVFVRCCRLRQRQTRDDNVQDQLAAAGLLHAQWNAY